MAKAFTGGTPSKRDLLAQRIRVGDIPPDAAVPMGRAVWSDDLVKRLEHTLKRGASVRAACCVNGLSTKSYYQHFKTDDDFRARMLAAREFAIEEVEHTLKVAATTPDEKGRYNVRAMEFFLTNKAQDRYRQRMDLTINSDPEDLEAPGAVAIESWSEEERAWMMEVAHARILGREVPPPPASLQGAIDVTPADVDPEEAALWAEA